MIEILLIFLQLVFFLAIFSYPINIFNSKLIIKMNDVNIYFITSINVIIHFTIYLIVSLTKLNIEYFFYAEILTFFIFILLYKNKIWDTVKKINVNDYRYFFIFILFNILFFLAIAIYPKLQWDGLAHWIFKAKIFYDGGNYFDFKNNIPFAYYPHLGTFVWGYFWKNSLLDFEYIGRFIYPFLYLLSIFLIASCVFQNKEQLIKKILLTIFLITISVDFFLFGGYQEYLLFFLFSIMGFNIILYFVYPNNTIFLYLIGFNLNLICWSKQEGFFYTIIIGMTLSIFSYRNIKNLSILLIFTILICTFSLLIKSYVIEAYFFNEKIINPEILKYLDIAILYNDLIIIIKHLVISAFKYPIILMEILLLLFFVKQIKTILDKYFYTLFFINILFVFSIYLQTSIDIEYLLPITLDRILLQTSSIYLIYLANKLRSF